MANNKLHLIAIDPDGVVHAAADGSLTGADCRAVGLNLFESLLGANWRSGRVILDFSQCAMIDSASIGWLVESNKQFKNAGGVLVLHSLMPRVRQVMELLNLQRLLNLAATEATARKHFQRAAATTGELVSTEAGR